MTGAPMPEGADAVVRVEDTREAGDDVEIRAAVAPGANVRAPRRGHARRRDRARAGPGTAARPTSV